MKKTEDPVSRVDADAVVAQWLEAQRFYPPQSPNSEEITLMTTDDIVRALSDMCELDINAVATAMMSAGYKMLFMGSGKHGWALARKPIN